MRYSKLSKAAWAHHKKTTFLGDVNVLETNCMVYGVVHILKAYAILCNYRVMYLWVVVHCFWMFLVKSWKELAW